MIKKFYNAAAEYMGIKEGGEKHKEIIKIYNTITPLPRGVKANTSYAWCAIFQSAIAKKLGFTADNFPFEMSCYYMYVWAVNHKRWRTTPKKGYLIIYDWKNDKTFDHVGFVYDETNNYINVIEGNFSDTVGTRRISKTNAEIRGYIDIGISESGNNNTHTTPTINNPTNNADKSKYTVVKGDTLSRIANKYGVSVAAIVAANNIKNPDIIYVGQVLNIPNKPNNTTHTAAEIERVAHEVIKGKYGNGETRKRKLENLGYNYNEVQAMVNKILYNR